MIRFNTHAKKLNAQLRSSKSSKENLPRSPYSSSGDGIKLTDLPEPLRWIIADYLMVMVLEEIRDRIYQELGHEHKI